MQENDGRVRKRGEVYQGVVVDDDFQICHER